VTFPTVFVASNGGRIEGDIRDLSNEVAELVSQIGLGVETTVLEELVFNRRNGDPELSLERVRQIGDSNLPPREAPSYIVAISNNSGKVSRNPCTFLEMIRGQLRSPSSPYTQCWRSLSLDDAFPDPSTVC
jgi:hypothetical protein